MPITRDIVEHVANLAHVGVEPDEIDHLAEQLSTIVDHVARLQELDTTDVPPTSYAVPLDNVTREDAVTPSWAPQAVLANAPRRVDDFFEVQAVLD